MITDLLHTVRSIADIPPEEEAKLCDLVVSENLKNGDTFIRDGDVP